jgi:hypothetical protein
VAFQVQIGGDPRVTLLTRERRLRARPSKRPGKDYTNQRKSGDVFAEKGSASNAYLFLLPFGVSMITCKPAVFLSNGASRTRFARPLGFFFLGTVVGLLKPEIHINAT